jgi:hypothetical protein
MLRLFISSVQKEFASERTALREPHGSVPGNPLVPEPLYLTQYIERMGTGTRDMIRLCREAGLPSMLRVCPAAPLPRLRSGQTGDRFLAAKPSKKNRKRRHEEAKGRSEMWDVGSGVHT